MTIPSEYDFELERIIATIRKEKPKSVCLQLADGLKPHASSVQKAIHEAFPETDVVIWGGSDYGGCDLPVGALNVDLLIAFGHAPWVWGDELKRYAKKG